jgi:cob(I)alamin adenosyltransferase
MKKGLLMLYTGSQTGTTAVVLGQVFRAIGRGFRICFIQFYAKPSASEQIFRSEYYKKLVEFHRLGEESIESGSLTKNTASSAQAWELAQKAIASGEFRIVVLEGIADLLKSNRLDEDSVMDFLRTRPAYMHIIATGSDAPESLIDVADLVTEVLETDRHRDSI